MQPIVNLPIPLYILGLNISSATPTTGTVLAIAPGQARDYLDNLDMPVGYPNYIGSPVSPAISPLNCPVPLFLDSAVVGANGLDQGAIAASSNYLIYLIADSRNFKPVAGLISLASNQFPLLPAGYDSWRLLGAVSTTAGSVFDATTIRNFAFAKSYFNQPPISVLAGGNSTTFAAVALTAGVPTTTDTFVIVYLDVIFTPAAVGHVVQIRPTGSTATSGLVTIVGLQAGVAQTSCVTVMSAVSGGQPSIDYKVSSASDSVSMLVAGYSVTLA